VFLGGVEAVLEAIQSNPDLPLDVLGEALSLLGERREIEIYMENE